MLSEEIYKKNLIKKMNEINPGWIDGDVESNSEKTADLVNHNLKIAIEIKDDEKYRHEFPPLTGEMITGSLDLLAKNKQFKDDAQDANRKFRNYPEYKSILLIRTELINIPSSVIRYIFEGMRRFVITKPRLTEIGRLNKYLSHSSTKEIGGYLLSDEKEYYYFKNPNSYKNRTIIKNEVEKIIGQKIKDLENYIN